MSLYFIFFSIFTSFITKISFIRSINVSKQIYLITSILVVLPTIYDFQSINVYYTTDGLADILILLTIYLIPFSIVAN